jgi:fatty-acyl-CoA synthase
MVVAVVALRDASVDDPADEVLATHVRAHLAGYKVPRGWIRVERCERLPTGKPDYAWARAVAERAATKLQ